MLFEPFSHEAKGPPRERASEDLAGHDYDRRFLAGVASVKVGRRMIIELHLDHDPVELTDLRHSADGASGAGRGSTAARSASVSRSMVPNSAILTCANCTQANLAARI